MISAKRSLLLSLVVFFSISTAFSAEDNWLLLHKGKGGDSDVYYKKDTIKKIDDNITEVYIYWCNTETKCVLQQMRIDCKNKKTAIGLCTTFVNRVETIKMDFSKAGWLWFDRKNSFDKKLIELVCKKK